MLLLLLNGHASIHVERRHTGFVHLLPEDLLQLELDAEVTTRASIASSFFMALFRAARSCSAQRCSDAGVVV